MEKFTALVCVFLRCFATFVLLGEKGALASDRYYMPSLSPPSHAHAVIDLPPYHIHIHLVKPSVMRSLLSARSCFLRASGRPCLPHARTETSADHFFFFFTEMFYFILFCSATDGIELSMFLHKNMYINRYSILTKILRQLHSF